MILALLAAAVLDGSDPSALHAIWAPVCAGVYELPWSKTVRLVVADSTERLYAYGSLPAMTATLTPAGGWVQRPGYLYIRLPDGSDPTTHTMHIAGPGSGVVVTTPGTVVESLTVRYFGDCGIWVRAPGCTIRSCAIENTGDKAILLDRPASHSLVENCTLRDFRISTWPWKACKAHAEEIQGVKNQGGPGSTVRGCHISGYFDGIQGGTGIQPREAAAESIAADYHVVGNTITNVLDDGIEVETVDGRNVRIEGNEVRGSTNAVSLAPMYLGPVYVLNNRFYDYREGALKNFGSQIDLPCDAQLYFVGNTCASSTPNGRAEGNGRLCGPATFMNNIFFGGFAWLINDRDPATFDFNLYWPTADFNMVRWNGASYYNLDAFRGATGQEAHGLQADPLFVDPAHGDYRLRPESPAIGAGACLPQFSTPCSASMGAPSPLP